MKLEVGDKIYYYSLKNGEINISEYKVVLHKGKWSTYKRAEYKYNSHSLAYYKDDMFGKLIHHGPGVWMKERDDEYVRKLFLEYEEGLLNTLQKQLDKKKKLIENLKNGA